MGGNQAGSEGLNPKTALTITIISSDRRDDLLSLQKRLLAERRLQPGMRLLAEPQPPGRSSAPPEALLIWLGPDVATREFAWALIAWLKHQRHSVRVVVANPDGTAMEIEARDLRRAGVDEVHGFVTDLEWLLGQR